MSAAPRIRPFRPADRAACLALFDANCPAFFAPNERTDYEVFLDANFPGYEVWCDEAGTVVGASGVLPEDGRPTLRWILIAPAAQGRGLGRAMMGRAVERMRALGGGPLRIATSQHSVAFFRKFGARETARTPDGWGPGMHRIDLVLD